MFAAAVFFDNFSDCNPNDRAAVSLTLGRTARSGFRFINYKFVTRSTVEPPSADALVRHYVGGLTVTHVAQCAMRYPDTGSCGPGRVPESFEKNENRLAASAFVVQARVSIGACSG